MAGTSLGSAYVQIVPSAQGIKGSLTGILNGEAGVAGDNAGKTISGKIKGAIAAAGIGVALGAALKKSLNVGAELEQTYKGGLDTIYGDAAEKAREYAREAQAAGVSQAQFSDQAISFGAALRQAYGGDMNKAVESANQAILDMTDNSAKMGTDIVDIQNAYQGFAKQNYTMLDNLKLGYGGTKGEMERLLADAEKLSGQKYDISNLGDVYEAIHVIQGDLGLTGVAAQEASETFSGSFGAMKAAAENLMGSLMLGDNVGPAMEDLANSASKFLFSNLIPAVGRIFKSLPTAIGTFIKTGLPQMKAAGMELINSVTGGADASQFGEKLAGIIIKNGPKVLSAIGTVANTLMEYLIKGGAELIAVGASMVANLVMGIGGAAMSKASGAAQKVVKAITSPFKSVTTYIHNIVNRVGSLLSFSGLSGKVKGVFNRVKTAIQQPIEKAKSLVSNAVKKIKGFFPFNLGKILHLKIPRISLSGGKAPWGIAGKGKLPSFNVTWAAKGMLLDDATLIGAGEAGREGIIPLEGRYMRPFAKTIAQEMPRGSGNTFNITLNANGTENPEQFAQRFAREVRRQVRAGAF